MKEYFDNFEFVKGVKLIVEKDYNMFKSKEFVGLIVGCDESKVNNSDYIRIRRNVIMPLIDNGYIIIGSKKGRKQTYMVKSIIKELYSDIQEFKEAEVIQEQVLFNLKKEQEDNELSDEKLINDFLETSGNELIFEFIKDGGDVYIDCAKLEKYNTELFDKILEDPKYIFKKLKTLLKKKIADNDILNKEYNFDIRLTNFPKSFIKMIRNIRVATTNKLISIKGIIKTSTGVIPKIKSTTYKCLSCGGEYKQRFESGTKELKKCVHCKERFTPGKYKKIVNTMDYQLVEVEEDPSTLDGKHPESIYVELKRNLLLNRIRRVEPGMNVQVNGIFEIIDMTDNNTKDLGHRTKLIDTTSFKILDQDHQNIKITDKDNKELKELSKDQEKLINSVAPSLLLDEEIKSSIFLQLVGGEQIIKRDKLKIRGNIHILLVGDPGTGKTQLMNHALKISPKSRKTTGIGSSGVGITATVRRDKITKKWALIGGDLVMCNNGIVGVDEFDKMNEEDRKHIHEALEDQTISISKAGIHATLNAQTSLLAGANPTTPTSLLQLGVPFKHQLNLPESIYSRFDLIIPFKQKRQIEDVEILINKMKENYVDIQEDKKQDNIISIEKMKKYVILAKQTKIKGIDEDAINKISEYSKTLISSYNANPRVFNTLFRLSQASSKARIDGQIKLIDAKRSIHLINYMYKKIRLIEDDGNTIDRSILND